MISVQTGQYRYNHEGKAPRGRGMWAFSIMKDTLWVGRKDGITCSGSNLVNDNSIFGILYSEAVKEAKRVARTKGATIITVLP